MYKIVLDTNVIVSALLKSKSNPALIVSLIHDGRVHFCLSQEIFNEYKGVLSRNKLKGLDNQQVKKLLRDLKAKALWVKPRQKVEIVKRDPEDNKFLECALEAKADYLITGKKNIFRSPNLITP